MPEADDFGYSQVSWEETTPANTEAVEAEYGKRLAGSVAAWNDLDTKARFIFSGLVGIATALAGYAFSSADTITPYYLVGLFSLVGMFSVAIALAATSLAPQEYSYDGGVTPSDLIVSRWAPLLRGGEAELRRLSGVKIKEYAKNIKLNEKANQRKSSRLKLAIGVVVVAFPASALSVFGVSAFVLLIHPSHTAIVAPVWLGVGGALAVGVVIGFWIGRRAV